MKLRKMLYFQMALPFSNRGKYLLYKQADQISVEFWTLKTLC